MALKKTIACKLFFCFLLIQIFAIRAEVYRIYDDKSIDSLISLANRNLNSNLEHAIANASLARHISSGMNKTGPLFESVSIICRAHAVTNRFKTAISTLREYIPMALKRGDSLGLARLYSSAGLCWYYQGVFDSSLAYQQKAIRLFERSGNKFLYFTECNLLAKTYIKTGNVPKASQYNQLAFGYFNKGEDADGKSWSWDGSGEVFYMQNLFEKSIEILNESYSGFKHTGNKKGMAFAALHKGNCFYRLMQDDSAGVYYNLSLANFSDLGDDYGKATAYSNLSRIYLEHGQTQRAIDFTRKALSVIKPGNFLSVEAGTNQQLGDIFGELKQNDSAIVYIQKALTAARKISQLQVVRDCYKSLSEIYEVMGRHDLAVKNLLSAYRLKDSIQPVLFNKQLAEMQAKFENEKKESEIKLLKQQSQIDSLKLDEQESKLKRQRYLLLMSLVIIAVIVVAVYYYLSRRKLLESIRKEKLVKETEEKERQRIAKDIHDELGSGLSKIKFLSELANNQVNNSHQLNASLHSISDTSRNLVENMRDLVWAMNPENTTLDNLVARIREYSYDYFEELPVELHIEIPDSVVSQKITKEQDRNVFMIVKETLQNVVKHSSATKVNLVIETNAYFKLRIEDNGTGYDTNVPQDGNGLRNIKARAAAIGAYLSLESEKGKGSLMILEWKLNV